MSSFRLEVVLRLRRLSEDAARVRLATSLGAHRDAVAEVARLAVALDGERAALGRLQMAAAAGGDLREAHDAVEHAERRLAAGQDRLERAGSALLEARVTLAEAGRRREVVERLRDRARLAERRAAERLTEKQLAEFATVRHAWAEIEEALR
jgi:flagellar protein FliJ